MTQDIRDFVPPCCELLALGEPTHGEPAFARVRNELVVRLVDRGFRSIALEIHRVGALIVNDFVQDGVGTLDTVMKDGFAHGFGELDANRELVAWLREYNESRPPARRVSFYGFDVETEIPAAPSPQRYLEYARDYLRLDLDIAELAGADALWSCAEAILDATRSIGDTPEADRLRAVANDMLTLLYARAPQLISATSRTEWLRARTHLTAGLGLLRYHKQAAQRLEQEVRWTRLSAIRDAIMAQNLLAIRSVEARRGPTLVFAHNQHLQRNPSSWREGEVDWFSAGSIVASLLGEQYTVVAGSLGRSTAMGLAEPHPDTYEGFLQGRVADWGLTRAVDVSATRIRTDTTPEKGYFPLDREALDGVDAVLHISDGARAAAPA